MPPHKKVNKSDWLKSSQFTLEILSLTTPCDIFKVLDWANHISLKHI